MIETAPRNSVLSIAKGLDEERATNHIRSPFHGIPILIKDNCATDPSLGMSTTTSSFALVDSSVPRDSHVVALLRKVGAIIIGKANLSEWANFRGAKHNGWSGLQPAVKLNPATP